MNILETSGMAWRALRERRLRSALTTLMVIIAATLLVSVNGLNAGFGTFIDRQLETLGANVLIISQIPTYRRGTWVQGPSVDITDSMVARIRMVPDVREVLPFIRRVATASSKGTSREVTVLGMDLTKLRLVYPSLQLDQGSLLAPGDLNGMVLGYGVAYSAGAGGQFARLGDVVALDTLLASGAGGQGQPSAFRRSYVVRGILKPLSLVVDDTVYLTTAGAKSLFKTSGSYDGLYVVTKGPEANEQVEAELKRIYGDSLSVTSPKAIAQTIHEIRIGFANLFMSVAAVSMVVASIGIVTTLFTSVLERTREIGLLKAIGFTDGEVLKLFLLEALLIGLLGGILGIASGVLFASATAQFVRLGPEAISVPPHFTAQDLAFTGAMAIGLSALAGLYPARRASKLDPVVALRRE